MVGSFLSWARVVTDQTSTSVLGISSGAGVVALLCGLLVLLVGWSLRSAHPVAARGRALVAAVLGLVVVGVTVNVLATHDRQVEAGIRDRLQATGTVGTTEVREAHADLVRQGLKATFGPGVYLSLAGGLLAVAGGSSAAGAAVVARRSLDRRELAPPDAVEVEE
ncbi:MAG TPA: hypothetical protein VKA30_12535 [Actinomycetota bacterium]|nr:hypothetical protein [Actinomycetota bacterium]